MADSEVVLDNGAIARFAKQPEVVEMLQSTDLLREIVLEMRRLAPWNTGKGAESIDFELDSSGEFYRISWDKDHFYMYFHEVGTIEISPHPFMRPVVDRYNNS